jgi:hypothetical protein
LYPQRVGADVATKFGRRRRVEGLTREGRKDALKVGRHAGCRRRYTCAYISGWFSRSRPLLRFFFSLTQTLYVSSATECGIAVRGTQRCACHAFRSWH